MVYRTLLFMLPLALLLSCAGGSARPDPVQSGPVSPELEPVGPSTLLKAFDVPGVGDPQGWAEDVAQALVQAGAVPNIQNTCSVAAIIEVESSFEANRPVSGVMGWVNRWKQQAIFRYEPTGGGAFAAALEEVFTTAGHGQTQSFYQRLDKARSEAELYALYKEMVDTFEGSWPRAFEAVNFAGGVSSVDAFDFSHITSAGCMGVDVAFIEEVAREDRRLSFEEAMDMVYTRAGCLSLGTRKLLGGHDRYDSPIYRFAEYHGAPFASRNAAFQERVKTLTGRAIPYDGGLLFYEGDGTVSLRPSPTFLGLLAMRDRYGVPLSESKMMRDLTHERSRELEDTVTWDRLDRTYLSGTGKQPAYARIPEISYVDLAGDEHPAAFFANQVEQAYQTCLLRVSP